jgi:class 3 adenylate cyclase
MQPGRYSGGILLADISGYSSFLIDVQTAHSSDAFADGQVPAAYSMMAGLLEGIATRVDPPFTVLKFEGDAAFAVAADGSTPTGQRMLDCVDACYDDFTERRAAAGELWTCTCDACSRSETLDLKFIVHHGEFYVHQVGGRVEAVGPAINVAHRLLKNNAAAIVGTTGYALFTDEAVAALELPLAAAARLTEIVDDGRDIGARVVPLPA